MKDLLVVVPDKTWELVIGAILGRAKAIGIRPVSSTVAVHVGRDGGVRKRGAEFAASLSRLHGRALLILDYEGCGDTRSAEAIEADIRGRLRTHWADRAEVIVVVPEIEVWLWRAISQIARQLETGVSEVRSRLSSLGFITPDMVKPVRPKEAFHTLLREARRVPSAAIYAEIARTASLRSSNCETASFPRFVSLLQAWFPRGPSQTA